MSSNDFSGLIGHMQATQHMQELQATRQRQADERADIDRENAKSYKEAERKDEEFRNKKNAPEGGWVDPNLELSQNKAIRIAKNRLRTLAGEMANATMAHSDITSHLAAVREVAKFVCGKIAIESNYDLTRLGVNNDIAKARRTEIIAEEQNRLYPVLRANYDYADKRRSVLSRWPMLGRQYCEGSLYLNWNPSPSELNEIQQYNHPPVGYEPKTDYYPPRAKNFKPVKTADVEPTPPTKTKRLFL